MNNKYLIFTTPDEELLNELYEEYNSTKYWENRDYAESIWEYISSKVYTDGNNGMKMYVFMHFCAVLCK